MDDISIKLADPCSILQFQSKTLIQFPDPQEAKGLGALKMPTLIFLHQVEMAIQAFQLVQKLHPGRTFGLLLAIQYKEQEKIAQVPSQGQQTSQPW